MIGLHSHSQEWYRINNRFDSDALGGARQAIVILEGVL